MKVEKSELKKNFTKLTQKKGISLIVLIVTIIVIIILAAVVILTVGNSNPVESAREAKFKADIQTFRDDLALSISKDYTSQGGQRNNTFSGKTYDEIKNYIPSFTKEYEGKIIVKDDELMYSEDIENKVISQKEKEWLKEAEIKEYAKTAAEKVYEDTSYYGKRITNYSANGITDWKIFHSDGKNVYIIASDYVPVDKLPETSTKHKPVNANSDYPKAATFNNIIGDYTGSSNITDERMRFDFNCDHKLTDEEKQKAEDLVNEWIKEALPVTVEEMSKEEAVKSGAECMFIEKYPDIVTVYTIGNVSKELCGGPHVKNTSELGHFKIKKEEASSAGVRRIKAILE